MNSGKNQGGNKTKLDLKTAFYFVKTCRAIIVYVIDVKHRVFSTADIKLINLYDSGINVHILNPYNTFMVCNTQKYGYTSLYKIE